jgi:hybrid cluster-associated redox disulfide protein
MKETHPPITQEMSIPEILEKFPQTLKIFQRYGITPQGYRAMAFENLQASCQVHQIDLVEILSELNQGLAQVSGNHSG